MPDRKIIIDIEDLASFHNRLHQFNQEMTGLVNRMDGHCNRLGETWRDQDYDRFRNDWDTAVRAIERFLDQSVEFRRHLWVKEQKLREAQNA